MLVLSHFFARLWAYFWNIETARPTFLPFSLQTAANMMNFALYSMERKSRGVTPRMKGLHIFDVLHSLKLEVGQVSRGYCINLNMCNKQGICAEMSEFGLQ